MCCCVTIIFSIGASYSWYFAFSLPGSLPCVRLQCRAVASVAAHFCLTRAIISSVLLCMGLIPIVPTASQCRTRCTAFLPDCLYESFFTRFAACMGRTATHASWLHVQLLMSKLQQILRKSSGRLAPLTRFSVFTSSLSLEMKDRGMCLNPLRTTLSLTRGR
jgi:hypothetical protein